MTLRILSDDADQRPPRLSPAEAVERLEEVRDRIAKQVGLNFVSDDDFELLDHVLRSALEDALAEQDPRAERVLGAGGPISAVDIDSEDVVENLLVLRQRLRLLDELIADMRRSSKRPAPSLAAPMPSTLERVELLLQRFHAMAVEFRKRHSDRAVFEVEDEYDVQDLLRAFLKLWFDDVRPEEWTPSYAGGSSRMDFLLKDEQLVVEVKRTRKGLAAKELGEQLIIDIGKYGAHQDCKTLVCFVYDPENRIHNPAGIEADLSGQKGSLTVKVLIRPRP